MAFTISYGPSAASVGSLGALIGSGQARRENSQMQNDFARQALGVMLQDRNAQNQYNLQLAGMLNTEAARASQLQFQQQQQQFDNQLALQQMQMQGEQFEARQQLAFAELDQQKQITELKGRPQASAVWQDLMGKQQYLDQALSEGLITPEQYEPLRMDLVQQAAGFDPHRFPYEGQFEPGKEIGDVWIEERETPMGKMPLEITRDRNGRPGLTDWSRIQLEAAAKAHFAKQNSQAGKSTDTSKPAVTLSDYAKLYQSVANTLADQDLPVNPALVQAQMQQIVGAYQQQFGVQQQGGWQGAPHRIGWDGVPHRGTGVQQPQGAGPSVTWQQPSPMSQPQAPVPQAAPQQPQMGPTVATPLSQLRERHAEMPDAEFAQVWTARAPQHVQHHLELRYPPGAGVEVTDPLDLALFTELRAMKERALRPSGSPPPAAAKPAGTNPSFRGNWTL